ncbi:MAG: ATP synthase subunit D [Omnitrophica WOR_2 bacterium SM23_72]|nr:MAG: ATP synthase subunit D [Omnitrophica WOR_2 bacterium SM23_72]
MGKIKLTKGELKRQRDALKQYQRYLPTLQLKKQQLQIEILHQAAFLEKKREEAKMRLEDILLWAGLLSDRSIDIKLLVRLQETKEGARNIAGVDLPVFEGVEFVFAEYDLFATPLWVDTAMIALQGLIAVRREIAVIEKGISILKQELRITTQRVNLFEKVKIPEAEEAIRIIKIYIGDQMANAVGRSKIAKRKIEELVSLAV